MRHRWAQPNRSSRVGPLTPVGYWPLVTLSKGPTLALRTSPRVRPFSDFEDHPNTSSMWARLLSDDVDRLKAGFLFFFFGGVGLHLFKTRVSSHLRFPLVVCIIAGSCCKLEA